MTHGTAPRISLQVHLQHRRLRQVTTDEAALYPSLLALQSGPRLLGFLGFYGPVAQSGERRPRMAEVRGSSPLGSTLFFCWFAGKTQRTRNRGQHGPRPSCSNRAATHRANLSLSSNTCGTPGCIHDLSCTPATLLLSENVNPKIVQEMLGHSTITQTMDTYSHVLPDMQDQAVRVIESALTP